ncbi:hypothetical protein GCM10023238_26740 [Streptomyces heliomycini]
MSAEFGGRTSLQGRLSSVAARGTPPEAAADEGGRETLLLAAATSGTAARARAHPAAGYAAPATVWAYCPTPPGTGVVRLADAVHHRPRQIERRARHQPQANIHHRHGMVHDV